LNARFRLLDEERRPLHLILQREPCLRLASRGASASTRFKIAWFSGSLS
jgi:hypothetical protein